MVGNYFELSVVKEYLEIRSTDTVDDDLLNQLGASANKSMDNFLITFTLNTPRVAASLTEDIKDAVNFKVISKYKAIKEDFEG